MIITIDGPAGAGKGTIAAYLAEKYNLAYMDTGLLYRALAKSVIKQKLDIVDDQTKIIQIANEITVMDTKTPDLRSEDIAVVASGIAKIPEVRNELADIQRSFIDDVEKTGQGAVIDGRDIGTVICPEAVCKLFITARPEIRSVRRSLELGTKNATQDSIAKQIALRDDSDTKRKVSPVVPAQDAFIIDTSDLSIGQACSAAENYVKSKCINAA